jgi:hypothetical protein
VEQVLLGNLVEVGVAQTMYTHVSKCKKYKIKKKRKSLIVIVEYCISPFSPENICLICLKVLMFGIYMFVITRCFC